MNDLIQWPRAKYWTGTFNPVVGCRPISEGCQNCYASSVCKRYDMNGDGQFNPTPKPNAKLPRNGVVFVGNMTDIFGEWNTDQQICDWINNLNGTAVNLILTKRAERLSKLSPRLAHFNRYYGVTAENQERYDTRIQDLYWLKMPHKWLSLEPLLSHIELDTIHGGVTYDRCGNATNVAPYWSYLDYIDWIVVGAESIGSRPGRECKIEWVESIVEQCVSAGVPVFVKQLHIGGKLVKDIEQFPEYLRIRQMPWEAISGLF